MKVMLDTNIIISAALFPNGRVSKAMSKALMPPFQPVVCDYIIYELHRKFEEKFPHKLNELEGFLSEALNTINVITTPPEKVESEALIRDIKDQPILRAALHANVDLLLTGDKDFLEAEITNPRIIGVAEFLEFYT